MRIIIRFFSVDFRSFMEKLCTVDNCWTFLGEDVVVNIH